MQEPSRKSSGISSKYTKDITFEEGMGRLGTLAHFKKNNYLQKNKRSLLANEITVIMDYK